MDFVSLIAREMARLHALPVTTAGPAGEAEMWHVLPKWLQLAKGELEELRCVRDVCYVLACVISSRLHVPGVLLLGVCSFW